jgi:transcription initiation factor TFIIH subunit 2
MTTPAVPSAGAPAATTGADGADGGTSHAWEDTGGHTWETAVREDADGRIIVQGGDSVADLIRRRRKRLEQNDYAQRNRRVVRDMIRYVYVLIDCSRWVRDKDPVLPPGSRIEAVIGVLHDFVQEYYDQNPLSHLGFVLMKNGEAEILTQLSSSSKTHKLALQSILEMVNSEGPNGGGEFSLQNGLEVAGRSLGHQPRHGSREVVIVCGALSTCDPGNVLTETLPRLKTANVRVSTIALAAEMHVCRKLAEESGGSLGVCLEKAHFRDWMLSQCVPPPALKQQDESNNTCEMVPMGFPTRTKADIPSLVHASRDTKLMARTSFTCPQCHAKVSDLPTDCVVCGLKLVLSPHLARSFHHLFPVAPFHELPPDNEILPASSQSPKTPSNALRLCSPDETNSCFSCLRFLGPGGKSTTPFQRSQNQSPAKTSSGKVSSSLAVTSSRNNSTEEEKEEILRFQCPECKNAFCVDCDTFLHETLHNCPGCLLRQ